MVSIIGESVTAKKVKLWEVRAVGKPPKFNSPEDMWERAVEYFEWVESANLEETKMFSFQGEVFSGKAPLMRPMTQEGLCSFLNVGVSTWHDYKKKPQYSEVIEAIESIMYEQKFSGAATGLLKENIIARYLGLHDKVESSDVTIHNIMPVPVADNVDDWEVIAKTQQERLLSHD